ncbi:2,3-diaminopropionate biosynthesis protein SbnA [Amycolatopsis taiwanensis]|uniref:2,3-diaminopropionate biosynthesis protein SbnA n=1 Tax=Amycolatopsis taiwanensis TaxID=342230 RepID=A0A9W6R9Q5_9PSEU|nr:2,3-diaminopropionate biosynthesis protein SbnA [Amycolatopsis taiwanensis]GLY71533.1 2,3-diaminopropionate biosynthesis protein SbnA [Amycolatopsis taiwanensis]
MIYSNVHDIILDDIFLELSGFASGIQSLLKIEGLNPAGSIKIKPAVELVDSLERAGVITTQSKLIESSSGNLGIALGIVCAEKRYPLTIVTDPNVSSQAVHIMEALGVTVKQITERDSSGGYLGSRIKFITQELERDPDLVWLNQYANPSNSLAHRQRTAENLHKEIGSPDLLVIGVGTSGTLMGCVEYFGVHSPSTRIVAVDSYGSVTFGTPPAQRRLPGLGTSRKPELFKDSGTFDKLVVSEIDAIRMCRRIAREYGLLVGGSTGTALVAAAHVAKSLPAGSRMVIISPDLGDKYVDTIYSDSWVSTNFDKTITPIPSGA